MNNLSIIVTYVIFTLSMAEPPSCGLYGESPCPFVPAPPGNTPSCAGPGQTYCENVQHYPKELIKHLIYHLGFDVHKLLADETLDEFNDVRLLSPNHQFFGPGLYNNHHYNTPDEGYQYPKPNSNGYSYNKPSNNGYNKFGNIYSEEFSEPIHITRPSDQKYNYQGYNNDNRYGYNYNKNDYSNNYRPYQKANNYQHNNHQRHRQVTEYNPANQFRRYTRDISNKVDINITPSLNITAKATTTFTTSALQNSTISLMNDLNGNRKKRQSQGRESLCQVNSQFISPQAALNSKGNWMYVINEEQATQLVKTETCASSVCSNLCQVPNGYNSRCEQKYVQKRLVALNGNGQNFYTDTFWFPSCCVCTIANQ